jgi:hypothetical protein
MNKWQKLKQWLTGDKRISQYVNSKNKIIKQKVRKNKKTGEKTIVRTITVENTVEKTSKNTGVMTKGSKEVIRSVVVVPLPRVPLVQEHMMEWKNFANRIIVLEAKRSRRHDDNFVNDLVSVVNMCDVDFTQMKSQISPDTYDFDPAIYVRIINRLLEWRRNLIDDQDRRESEEVSKGLTQEKLRQLTENLENLNRENQKRQDEENIYRMTHTKEEYEKWQDDYYQKRWNEYKNSGQYERLKERYGDP